MIGAMNKFDTTIKKVRLDNGLEFLSKGFLDFLHKLWIKQQLTCPHTPRQNLIVERKHIHLLDVDKCLMFQSNQPHNFWRESIIATTYQINRTPYPTIDNETPYQRLFGHPINYSRLKVFGYLFYDKDNSSKTKFEPRVIKGVFLGYATKAKATRY